MAEVRDEKYVVFKREEWENYEHEAAPLPVPIEDAVVIRRQDRFAGPALHAYAACIAMVAAEKPELMPVADYFHEQAVLADEEGRKLPD